LIFICNFQALQTRQESRSQTRGSIARQHIQAAGNVAATGKQSKKVSLSTPVTYSTPNKDVRSVNTRRSISSGDTKQTSATSQRQSSASFPDSLQNKVSSMKKEKTTAKNPDGRETVKRRRWAGGGPIEYSTPPSDHSSTDKTGKVGDRQKSIADDTKGGDPSSKRNIVLAFDACAEDAGKKMRGKDSDVGTSTAARGKRKKDEAAELAVRTKGSSKGMLRKKMAREAATVELEMVRTKRMARLNAEAIVSLIYKHDKPTSGSKFHDSSDSDDDSDSSELSSEGEDGQVASRSQAKTSCHKVKVGMLTHEKSLRKLDKSPKSKRKVSSESCKKKSVEVSASSGWSPSKRMASLNAQVCFVFVSVPVLFTKMVHFASSFIMLFEILNSESSQNMYLCMEKNSVYSTLPYSMK